MKARVIANVTLKQSSCSIQSTKSPEWQTARSSWASFRRRACWAASRPENIWRPHWTSLLARSSRRTSRQVAASCRPLTGARNELSFKNALAWRPFHVSLLCKPRYESSFRIEDRGVNWPKLVALAVGKYSETTLGDKIALIEYSLSYALNNRGALKQSKQQFVVNTPG